jgi:hypothetical protein
MAGTFADQATLASDNAFIAKVRAAMIYRATELFNSQSAQTWATLNQARGILNNAAADAANIAALVASGNATIAAAAPAVPNDSDTQYAVNTVLTALLK